MGKAEVSLVFGKHSDEKTRSRGDTKFFKKAVGPILEGILSSGKKGVIIHEATFALPSDVKCIQDLKGCSDQGYLTWLRDDLTKISFRIRQELMATLDNGKPYDNWEPWGFEPVLQEINQKDPGRILNVVEPQAPHLLLSTWLSDIVYATNQELATEFNVLDFMKLVVVSDVHALFLRDHALSRMIVNMAQDDLHIIVPRGRVHACLSDSLKLFHGDLLDIRSITDGNLGTPIEHMIQSMASQLSKSETVRSLGPDLEDGHYLDSVIDIIENGGTGLLLNETTERCALEVLRLRVEQISQKNDLHNG